MNLSFGHWCKIFVFNTVCGLLAMAIVIGAYSLIDIDFTSKAAELVLYTAMYVGMTVATVYAAKEV